MKAMSQFTKPEEARALPILLRHSAGTVLPDRTYVLDEESVTELPNSGIPFVTLSHESSARTGGSGILKSSSWLTFSVAFLAMLPTAAALADPGQTPAQQAAIQDAARRCDSFWRQIAAADPRPTSGCRQLLGTALALCEARVHPERIERLLALAQRMQDQDANSKTWGNLRWYWRDAGVTDTNAVEFCMQDALLLHIRHGQWLPPAARRELAALVRLGVEGCLRHRVPTDYTNIAILNAGNLIVLGERLDRGDAAREGCRRLDALCLHTAAFGVHEFCSPTYYGTDLNGLLLIHSYARGKREQQQAEALLRLFWTDIAANWFPAARRWAAATAAATTTSAAWAAWIGTFGARGGLSRKRPAAPSRREPLGDEWAPPSDLAEMARRQLPRLVRQRWGILPAECRTQTLYGDVSLSCCGAAYGNQDSTLAVDLAGGRDEPRCYFIPDGREDPYGKKKYETGAARHPKALHLQPYWAGAQRSCDALGLVIYRPRDLAGAEVTRVQSHFVFRRPDALWLGDKRLTLPTGTAERPAAVPIPVCRSLVLRYGSAAVGVSFQGIQVPLSLRERTGERGNGNGSAASSPLPEGERSLCVKLVDDGIAWHCLRLTIDHGGRSDLAKMPANKAAAAAAIWVRVGSGLSRDADFDAWRGALGLSSGGIKEISDERVLIEAAGKDGALLIDARAPWDSSGRVKIVPPPCQGVLEVDGREVGRPLLAAVEPLRSQPPDAGPLRIVTVPAGKPFYWEAESGLVLPGMAVGDDSEASGGRFVGQEVSPIGQPGGSVTWSLAIEKPGRYWLWARARSADSRHGSFSFRVIGNEGALLPTATWTLRSAGAWRWQPSKFEGEKLPAPLELPQGVIRLQLQTRQSGTMIDRLMLTADPQQRPS